MRNMIRKALGQDEADSETEERPEAVPFPTTSEEECARDTQIQILAAFERSGQWALAASGKLIVVLFVIILSGRIFMTGVEQIVQSQDRMTAALAKLSQETVTVPKPLTLPDVVYELGTTSSPEWLLVNERRETAERMLPQ